MTRLTGVFLRDLQLDGFVGFFEAAEEWRDRLARLKIDRAVFDLDDDVVVELAVERMKIVVGGARAIVFRIAPVEMMVVDEGAIEDEAAVRFESAGDDVGGVGGRAMIGRRAEAAFGIGFDDYAAEVGDFCVDLVEAIAPPFRDGGIERIECVEAADAHRAADIDGDRELYAPGAENVGDAHELRQKFGSENARVCVDIVDGAAVDADGGEQAGVVVDAREIGAHVVGVEENRAAAVAAFDGAVEIVPVVDPADWGGGLLRFVDVGEGFEAGDFAEEGEDAVEDAAVVAAGDAER